jgi:transposase
MGLGVEAFPPMGAQGRIRADFRDARGRSRFRVRGHRRNDRQGPPARRRRKRGTQNQAIGRSRGGLTTKIVALVDALGNLVRFTLLAGQRHDSIGVEPLIANVDFGALLADKAFDNDALRTSLKDRGAAAVIPATASRSSRSQYDVEMYKWRHLVELLPADQGIPPHATRYDKTDTSYEAGVHLIAAFLALR